MLTSSVDVVVLKRTKAFFLVKVAFGIDVLAWHSRIAVILRIIAAKWSQIWNTSAVTTKVVKGLKNTFFFKVVALIVGIAAIDAEFTLVGIVR